MTNIERITLINQFEILKNLSPEESNYYEEKIEILEGGYKFHYDEIFSCLSPELSSEDSRFVLDILNMYRDVNFSKREFNERELEEISDIETQYKGFDYNDEYEASLGVYAKFFIKKLNRFQELVEDENFDDYNSHRLMVKYYKTYLDKYNNIKKKREAEFSKLTPKQIKEILG